MLMWVVSKDQGYDARARACLKEMCRLLQLDVRVLYALEAAFASEILGLDSNEAQEDAKQRRVRKNRQMLKAGAAVTVSGVLIGVTGGLAAPLVGLGLGSVFGAVGISTTAFSAFLSGAGGAVLLGVLFGTTGGGLAGYKLSKRYGKLKDFSFLDLQDQPTKMMSVQVCVGGWLKDATDFQVLKPWRFLEEQSHTHPFVMAYDRDVHAQVGNALEVMAMDEAVGMMGKEVLKRTVLGVLISALVWPAAVLKATSLLDNPWGMLDRV